MRTITLTSLPKWDGKNLLVLGGSQGGQLTIVTTALDPRVTALAASYPAYSDVTGYLRGRTGGWPGLFRAGADGKPGDAPIEAKLVTTTYYDTVNFARRLKVPGFCYRGYNDETCPPTRRSQLTMSLPRPNNSRWRWSKAMNFVHPTGDY